MDKNKYLIRLSESPNVAFGKEDFLNQIEEQQVFSAIWALESEVNNGGFFQYFSSWEGDTSNFAPLALRRIGANICASIVERALAAASGEPLPTEYEKRKALIGELPESVVEELSNLDSEFFAYPDNLTDLLFDYVRCNPDVFGPITEEHAG